MEKNTKKYSEQDLSCAVAEVKEGKSTLRAAAKAHGIPKSTLEDRIKERWSTMPEGSRGAPTALSAEDEAFIVSWILQMAAAGFPVNERSLIVRVAEFAKNLGKETAFQDGIPSRGWMARFLQRHPQLSRRTASIMSKKRVITEEDVRGWFAEVGGDLMSNEEYREALKDPSRVSNMDESPFCPVAKKQKVIAKKGTKHVPCTTPNNSRESYTVLMAGCADGKVAPPLIVFPYKERMPTEVTRSVPRGWGIGKTGSGWMNSIAFFEYISKIFYPWLLQQQVKFPVILTHVMQPLDVAFFAPMKAQWEFELKEWLLQKKCKSLLRTDLAPLLEKTLNAMGHKEESLVHGFRKCALVPFDVDAFDFSQLTDPADAPPNLTDMNRSKTEIVEIHPNSADLSGCQQLKESELLQTLNKRLSPTQFELFVQHRNKLSWCGPVEDSGLFYFWRNLMDEIEGPPDYLMLDSPFNEVMIDDAIYTEELSNELKEDKTSAACGDAFDADEDSGFESSMQIAFPPQDGAAGDVDCPDENFEELDGQNRSQTDVKPAQSQQPKSKKRTYPSVATSDEWFRIYQEEEAENLAVEEAKKLRIQQRATNKMQKEKEKQQRADERLKKKLDKEKCKKR
ncbi:uncharacterized protein LOC119769791 [Culex quinquefasciatus]|uniref:uncharacterized protein LOC119769791 n=1 Tax=Culex quinquefasciatus TaxID=7176 RepID=UPI0018E29685|nr:uncharacterized protein LOC119769791 [Culex quinquefasciatus]